MSLSSFFSPPAFVVSLPLFLLAANSLIFSLYPSLLLPSSLLIIHLFSPSIFSQFLFLLSFFCLYCSSHSYSSSWFTLSPPRSLLSLSLHSLLFLLSLPRPLFPTYSPYECVWYSRLFTVSTLSTQVLCYSYVTGSISFGKSGHISVKPFLITINKNVPPAQVLFSDLLIMNPPLSPVRLKSPSLRPRVVSATSISSAKMTSYVYLQKEGNQERTYWWVCRLHLIVSRPCQHPLWGI